MKKTWVILLTAFFWVTSCESPSSPDFEVQQSIELPLIKSITYEFLGEGSGVIVDSTSEDFEDLFQVGDDQQVSLFSDVEFGIGDLDDIIPNVDVDPTDVESEIGLIEVDDFSSDFSSEIGTIDSEPETLDDEDARVGVFEVEFDGSGDADFERVTGLDPQFISPGDEILAPADPVVIEIELDAGDFQSAVIEQGAIRFEFENNLGFNIGSMDAELISDFGGPEQDPVGSELNFGEITHNSTSIDRIVFDPGEEVKTELVMQVTIDWDTQNMQAVPGDLVVGADDEDLEVNNATANVGAQELNPATEDLVISNPDFEYAVVVDEPEPGEAFELIIEFENQTQLPVTNSDQSGMPTIAIFNDEGQIMDQVTVFENQNRPGALQLEQNETARAVIDLRGFRMTRVLEYDLDIGTQGGAGITVDQDDLLRISSSTSELKFSEARTDIDQQSDIELEDVQDVEGDFVNAEVETGQLTLTFDNESEIPLFIDNLRFFNDQAFNAKNTGRFFAEGSDIGEISNLEIPPQSSVTEVVNLDGVGISNRIAYQGTASSAGTNEPVTVLSTNEITTFLDGSVEITSANSVLDAQNFSTSGEVEISDEDFVLSTDDHFVDIASGVLNIGSLVNEIDLDIDTLIISFPDIRMDTDGSGRYDPADTLSFEFTGDNRIRRGSDPQNLQPEIAQSLENARIIAPGNVLRYNVKAVTEGTRDAVGDDTVRTVNASDRFIASVDIEDLSIRTAFGEVRRRVELLNDDVTNDGILELFDDREAEVTEIDDLDEISERISNLNLTNPKLDLIYDTNLGVRGSVIAAIVGVNDSGEEVFLSGRPGTDYEVSSDDDYLNLYARNSQIDPADMITFDITPAGQIGDIARSQVVSFDRETSNVDEFLSNLPVEVRFIGKVIANPDGEEGFIVDPVEFETSMGIDIPLNLSTDEGHPASVNDTISTDLSDLPEPDDDVRLREMTLNIIYENALPFTTGFNLEFLDENDQLITNAVGEPIQPVDFSVEAAQVDQVSRFVSQPKSGMAEVTLSGDQLDNLYLTRKIKLTGILETSRDEISSEVKLRSTDFITLGINASFTTSIRVN